VVLLKEVRRLISAFGKRWVEIEKIQNTTAINWQQAIQAATTTQRNSSMWSAMRHDSTGA